MIKCILKRLLKEHREECYRCLSIGKMKFKMYSSKYAFRQLQEDISRLDQRYDDLNSQHRQLVSQYVHLQDCYENLRQNIPELINRSHKRQTDWLSKIQKEQDRQSAEVQCLIKAQLPNAYTHLSDFSKVGNAGDNLLVPALRDSIQKISGHPMVWCHKSVRNALDAETVELINATRGLVIGGGGLFLRDTNRNDISGWQWPCSLNELDKIQVPMYMLGVGYNRFRGQEEFEPYFKAHINEIVRRFSFVGLRNHGSVRAIRQYVSDGLKGKVCYHPCATTVLSKIYQLPDRREEKVIALNCAFDRSGMRYGAHKEERLCAIAKILKQYEESYTIKYYVHMSSDKEMLPFLDAADLKYEVVELDQGLTVDGFLKAYCAPTLVLAMRGHAQMIPFGCGTPVLSIISHDKLKWFLEDIGHLEWGVEIQDKQFEQNLSSIMGYMLSHIKQIKAEMQAAQDRLWEITQTNIKRIFECDQEMKNNDNSIYPGKGRE